MRFWLSMMARQGAAPGPDTMHGKWRPGGISRSRERFHRGLEINPMKGGPRNMSRTSQSLGNEAALSSYRRGSTAPDGDRLMRRGRHAQRPSPLGGS